MHILHTVIYTLFKDADMENLSNNQLEELL